MRFYFSESERRRYWFKVRLIFYGIAFVLGGLTIGTLYAVRETSLFALNGLYVLGIPQSERTEFIAVIEPVIYKNAFAGILGSDNFLAWPGELPLPGPEFSDLKVEKNFLDRTVTIRARRRDRFGIWCFLNTQNGEENAQTDPNSASEPKPELAKCFWIDSEEGVFFEEAPYGKGRLFLAIFERDNEAAGVIKPVLGDRALDEIGFRRFQAILDAMRELELASERIEFDRLRQSIYFITSGGPTLEFSLRFDLDKTHVNALRELFSSRPPESLRYIDLTVQNKMYVK